MVVPSSFLTRFNTENVRSPVAFVPKMHRYNILNAVGYRSTIEAYKVAVSRSGNILFYERCNGAAWGSEGRVWTV